MAVIRLVVFDIAGTIIEDRGEVLAAFSLALQKSGIPFTEDELKEWKGASKREVIRHFVEHQIGPGPAQTEKIEATYDCFRTELQDLYAERIVPIKGAASTFSWCRQHDIQISNPQPVTRHDISSVAASHSLTLRRHGAADAASAW